MIIIDYNGVALSSIFANKADSDEDFIRHCILNSIRMYNKMFRADYGQVVIAREGGSWRKDIFPEYKAKRKSSRDKDDRDWDLIFSTINTLAEDLSTHFPYKVIQVQGAEADDIIGALSYNTQEFGNYEPVMIVSADKDFLQLQKLENVAQYSPMTKKLLKENNPRRYLQEHLIKGDSGDGIPNVLSPDNTFVEGIRQTPIRKNKLEDMICLGEEDMKSCSWYRNYQRNKKLIDLSETPDAIKQEIINNYNGVNPESNKMKTLNYLIKNRCNMLIECVEEFF
jgi:5'-3' exonuclease